MAKNNMKHTIGAIKAASYAGRKLKSGWAHDIRKFDGDIKGYGIRFYQNASRGTTGGKVFVLRYTSPTNGIRRLFPLGAFGDVTPDQAMTRAIEARGKIANGIDPLDEKADVRTQRTGGFLFANAADQFLQRHVTTLRASTARGYRDHLTRLVLPKWRRLDIRHIKLRDVATLLDDIGDAHGAYTRNRALATIRKLFNWCMGRGLIESVPIAKGMATPEKSRERWLNDDEIAGLWRACDAIGWPHGPFVKFLLLTGQRKGEVERLRWEHINDDVWTIPASSSKNAQEHHVPLTDAALAIIEAQPRLDDCGYVFGSGNKGDVSLNFGSKAKKKLDVHFNPADEWRIHDIRRAVRTHLAKLDVRSDIAELVLNHTVKGIQAVYDQHRYLNDKRAALDAWAGKIDRLVNGENAANVADIGTARTKRRRRKR